MDNLAKVIPFRPSVSVVERQVADIDDGYTRIANELLEAVMAADLTARQLKVVLAVIRKTYGFGKKFDWISGEQLSQMTGLPRTRCSTTKTELMEMKILITEGRKFGVNKYLHEWVKIKPARRREYGSTKHKAGYIYVFAAQPDGPVKIGFTSRDPQFRLQEVSNEKYFGDLKPSCHFVSEFMLNAGAIEPQIHEFLARRMIKGELFDMSVEAAISEITTVINTFKPCVTDSVTPYVNADSCREGHTKETIQKKERKDPPKSPKGECGGQEEKPVSQKKPAIDYQAVLSAYNSTLGDRLPQAEALNDKRRRGIKRLLSELKEPTVEAVENYFSAFSRTAKPFYFGDNDTGWRASFDYLLRSETLVKTREGSL